jgi:hypothetical protein
VAELGRAQRSGPIPFRRRRPGPIQAALAVALLLAFASCQTPARTAESPSATPAVRSADAEAFLDDLEHRTFRWFWDLADPQTGLIPDRAPTPSFSSVAAVGFGLTAEVIGSERGWIGRREAAARAGMTLRFLRGAPQGPNSAGATGYRGFFYHFLDMRTGRRFEKTELSTIDSALLFAGALTCASYFDREDPIEASIREDADAIYRRAEWDWASPRPPGVAMGWTPEEGFHGWNWRGYDESMILYVLALGSPTHPADQRGWDEFVSTYRWGTYFGKSYLQFSPLFGHQYSHVWIDFRGIADRFMREKGIDYFENSRRATLAQRAYAIANPMAWRGYGADAWGLTACDGPLDGTLSIDGRRRTFHSYWPRGASLVYVNDDGTIAPAAAAGSIPFAPEIAIAAVRTMAGRYRPHVWNQYGFVDAFNPTLDVTPAALKHGRIVPGVGWFDSDQLGIDQGPIVAMIENYRSELLWRLLRGNPYVNAGLKRAGFSGGWLDASSR